MAQQSARAPASIPRIEAQSVGVSVVIPVFNEEATLAALIARLCEVMDGVGETYDLVFVDDGSRDGTIEVLRAARAEGRPIKVVELSRNFGKEIAMTAGLDHADGRAVVVMDADLQDPPELIPQLVAKWREGFDTVYATRNARHGETWLKRGTSSLFYYLLSKTSDTPIPGQVGDFRLMDRSVVEALRRLPENNRFMKGLFAWVGFRQAAIEFDRPARAGGQSKWNYRRLWRLSLDGITSFSSMPLKVAGYLGLLVSLGAFGYAVFLITRTAILGIDVPGYASLMVVTLLLGGLQLFTLGVIGEYLSRVFVEVKNRPLYLVRRRHGFREDDA